MTETINKEKIMRRRRMAERVATIGLLIICCGLAIPFFAAALPALQPAGRWVFAAGALIYTAARCVRTSLPGESARLARLRRMEFWAGVAFCFAAFFWFYNTAHLGPYAGMLAVVRQTVLFSLVGAVIQVVASWLIAREEKKQ